MPKGVFPRPAPEVRFWAKVDRRGPDECWPWLAGTDKDGYGKFVVTRDGRHVDIRAHRFALELAIGPIGDLHVIHSCDNPPCCNARHLRAGTNQENTADKMRKGRFRCPIGETVKTSKLRATDVIEIRRRCRSGEPQASIANAFGVSQSQVSNCHRRKQWRHLQENA